MLSHDKIIIAQYSSSIGNGVGSKTVKMAEIEKNKIQVSIKVGYELYVPEVSDLAINIFSVPLQHYIYRYNHVKLLNKKAINQFSGVDFGVWKKFFFGR